LGLEEEGGSVTRGKFGEEKTVDREQGQEGYLDSRGGDGQNAGGLGRKRKRADQAFE